MSDRRAGFALIEVAAVLCLLAVVAVMLVVCTDANRRTARVGADLGKLKAIGGLGFSFAADKDDRFWGFTWEGGVPADTEYDDLELHHSDLGAHANQATHIIRRLGEHPELPRNVAWVADVLFSHLPLIEHMQLDLPDPLFASAGDDYLRIWQSDPLNWKQLGTPLPASANTNRWPYASSFQSPPAWWDEFQNDPDPLHQSRRVSQTTTSHQYWSVPASGELGPARFAQAAFPSDKVLMHDKHARYFGQVSYFTLEHSRVTMLMADGSAAVRRTGDANPGWNPANQTSTIPQIIPYTPESWEPPAINGSGSDLGSAHYRFTRGGLLGRDFGGPEIDTGQPR